MSPRTRVALIITLTVLAIAASVGYMAWRAVHWHARGWAGVYYIPQSPSGAQHGRTLGVGPWHVFVTASGPPADGRLLFRDEILAINGVSRDDAQELAALDASARRGSLVVYRVRRNDRIIDVPLRMESPLRSWGVILRHVVALVVALTFISIAVLIVVRRPGDTTATVFYFLALLSAIAVIGQAATIYEQGNARGIVSAVQPASGNTIFFAFAGFMYPPLLLHLALVFPRRRPVLDRHPYVIRWIYAGAAAALLMVALTAALVLSVKWDDLEASEATIRLIFSPIRYGLIILAALAVLRIVWASRREGYRLAVLRRPFLTGTAVIGLLFAIGKILSLHVSRHAAGILGGLTVVLPLLALGTLPFLACIALYRSYRAANIEEKRQVTWPLWGLLIGAGGKILIWTTVAIVTAWAIAHRDLLEWRGTIELLNNLATLVTVAIPISFAVAILKYRLMNIDVIIRKTVVYAILSGAIVVLYLGLVGVLGTLLVNVAGVQNQTLVIAATLVVAAVFVPMRNKLQTLVDRNLFRHKFEYPDALLAISTDSRTAEDPRVLLVLAVEKVQQALQNRSVVAFVERQDEMVAVAKVGVADSILGGLRVPKSIVSQFDRPFDPRRRPLDPVSTASLARIDAVLVVPIGTRGFLAAAAKLSGGELDIEDVAFLRSVSEQLAMAIDRIRMEAEEEDFAQARAIQQTLLPREMPRIPKLDISGVWQPAKTMGGDYYDLLQLSEHELAFCIGDVAGKGMPAALLMSGLQAAVRASASSSPRDLCERVRRVIVSSLSGGRFVTFFYATADTATMRLRWCNAGHNAPILARADGTIVRLSQGGPAFSRLFRDDGFAESEIPLLPGDRIVLFTDGVSEASDAAGEMFGEERIETVCTVPEILSASELQQRILENVAEFSGHEREDDVTLVVVRVEP